VKMNYRSEIRFIAKELKIGSLLHFTQAKNLPSIVKYGLLSRHELIKSMHMAFTSDKYRLDENSDAISVSISRVNGVMFQSKRRKSMHKDWLILIISPEILWTLNCKFCWCNAARNEIKKSRMFRGGPWAFRKMFARNGGTSTDLPVNCPTDPEAEIQVMEPIVPSYILGVIVNTPRMAAYAQGVLKDLRGDCPLVLVENF
jgi:hypothetical protein